MTELITRLLALAERAVHKALIYDCSDPEDRYICRELQELRELVQQRADGPTDEEILMTYQHAVSSKVESIVQSTGGYQGTLREHAAVTLAGLHAVLARWGCPAITPIPLSERLPTAKDCDAEGRCWAVAKYLPHGIEWTRAKATDKKHFTTFYRYWLPHHALPAPTTQEAS